MYMVNRTCRSQDKTCTSKMRSAALTFQNAIVCISFLVVVSDCSVNSEEAFFSCRILYSYEILLQSVLQDTLYNLILDSLEEEKKERKRKGACLNLSAFGQSVSEIYLKKQTHTRTTKQSN